jgi:hypothetical protein
MGRKDFGSSLASVQHSQQFRTLRPTWLSWWLKPRPSQEPTKQTLAAGVSRDTLSMPTCLKGHAIRLSAVARLSGVFHGQEAISSQDR